MKVLFDGSSNVETGLVLSEFLLGRLEAFA